MKSKKNVVVIPPEEEVIIMKNDKYMVSRFVKFGGIDDSPGQTIEFPKDVKVPDEFRPIS